MPVLNDSIDSLIILGGVGTHLYGYMDIDYTYTGTKPFIQETWVQIWAEIWDFPNAWTQTKYGT